MIASAVFIVCLLVFILIYITLNGYKPQDKPVIKYFESCDRPVTKSATEVLICNIVGHKTIEVTGPTICSDELGCSRCRRLYTRPGYKYDRFFDKINAK